MHRCREWITVPLGACCIPRALYSNIMEADDKPHEQDCCFDGTSFIQLQYGGTGEPTLSMILECIPYGITIPEPTNHLLLVASTHQALVLHPQVEEFLVLSAQTLFDLARHDTTTNNTTTNTTLCQHPETTTTMVQLHLPSYSNYTISTLISMSFQIKPISGDIIFVPTQLHGPLSITLEYISCTDDTHDQLLQSIFYPLDDSTSIHPQLLKNQTYLCSLFISRLQGYLIQEHTCIALPLPIILFPQRDPYHKWEEDKNDKTIAVFFFISSIQFTSQTMVSISHTPQPPLYYVGTTDTIQLHISCRNKITTTDSPVDVNLHQPPRVTLTSYPNQTTTTMCHGYPHLLDELLFLAHLNSPTASPAATLLVGCSGVGKTQLAYTLLNRLVQDKDPRNENLHIQYISAKDVILAASVITQVQDLVYYIYPPLFQMKRQTKSHSSTTPSSLGRIVLVLDDLDVLIGKEQEEDDSKRQDSEQMCALYAITQVMDQILSLSNDSIPFLLGIGSSDELVHSSILVRKGRFEKVVSMPPPTQHQRHMILEQLFQDIPLVPLGTSGVTTQEGTVDIVHPHTQEHGWICTSWAQVLASQTAGCVAADLKRIQWDALTRAMTRHYHTHVLSHGQDLSSFRPDLFPLSHTDTWWSRFCVQWDDIKESARNCVPSQLAHLDVSTPRKWDRMDSWDGAPKPESWKRFFEYSWECLGGYRDMKERVYRSVVRPWKCWLDESEDDFKTRTETNQTLQISPPNGVLLHGPSGTGKTLAATCLASSLSLNMIQIRASDILDKWLGGSEAIVRSLFARARSAAPCILLFDDIESVSSNRESDGDGMSSDVYSRILSTLLNEMDGVSSGSGEGKREKVLVVATSNRIQDIDAALLRPGRFDVHIHMDKPGVSDALEIFRLHLSKVELHSNVNLGTVAQKLVSLELTGANIQGLCEDACMIAIDRIDDDEDRIILTMDDLEEAMKRSHFFVPANRNK